MICNTVTIQIPGSRIFKVQPLDLCIKEPFKTVLRDWWKSLYKKWSFPLRISSVNVTKSKLCIFVQWKIMFFKLLVNWEKMTNPILFPSSLMILLRKTSFSQEKLKIDVFLKELLLRAIDTNDDMEGEDKYNCQRIVY